MENFKFIRFQQEDINSYLSLREGEEKLGQCFSDLEKSKYVIIGVEESIGPRANGGRKGAENGFDAFLHYFVNMQANESLEGNNICVLGKVQPPAKEKENLSEMVEELDAFLFDVLNKHISINQIPILIGGGHNNAFPLMKFASIFYDEGLVVMNLDAHADYRPLEGRHSGNSFSYAFQEGYLEKYFALGLHKRYNSQQILDDLRRDKHYFTFHEDYIIGKRKYHSDFEYLSEGMAQSNVRIGLELDLDTIKNMPSSAMSPVGIDTETARAFIKTIPLQNKIAYFHLPEGAPTTELEKRIVGKSLAYFTADFIEANESAYT